MVIKWFLYIFQNLPHSAVTHTWPCRDRIRCAWRRWRWRQTSSPGKYWSHGARWTFRCKCRKNNCDEWGGKNRANDKVECTTILLSSEFATMLRNGKWRRTFWRPQLDPLNSIKTLGLKRSGWLSARNSGAQFENNIHRKRSASRLDNNASWHLESWADGTPLPLHLDIRGSHLYSCPKYVVKVL